MNEFFRDDIGGRVELHFSIRYEDAQLMLRSLCTRPTNNNNYYYYDDDDDDNITSNLPIASPGKTVSRQACHTKIFGSSSVGRWTNASYFAIQAERRAHFPTTGRNNNAKRNAPAYSNFLTPDTIQAKNKKRNGGASTLETTWYTNGLKRPRHTGYREPSTHFFFLHSRGRWKVLDVAADLVVR